MKKQVSSGVVFLVVLLVSVQSRPQFFNNVGATNPFGGIGPLNNFGSSSFQSMGIGQGVGNLAANGQGMAGGASLGPFGGFALGTGAGFGLG